MKRFSFCSLLHVSLAATLLAIAFFALVACNETSDKKPEQAKLFIVATIYPEYDWIKEILGSQADSVNLTLLLKNGIDLHSFKPTAQDIAKIASADMVVYVGGESDEWIEDSTPKQAQATFAGSTRTKTGATCRKSHHSNSTANSLTFGRTFAQASTRNLHLRKTV